MKAYIGLDIGGTKILGALFDEDGSIIAMEKKKTKAVKGPEAVMEQIYKVIDGLMESREVELQGIGAGSPGLIKNETIITFSPNIPYRDFDLGARIQEKYNVPFILGNDVNVAMFGEWKALEMVDARNVIGIFVGTGVGGAIIIDGQIFTGQGGAAELGHMTMNLDGVHCGCGAQGCLEAYASKTGIQNAIKAQIKRGRKTMLKEMLESDGDVIKSSSLKKAYDEGDELGVEVMDQAARYLGAATASLINLFHPDLIILGGGIMESMAEELTPQLMHVAKSYTMPGMLKDVRFERSHLGDHAGIIGAYEMIRAKLDKGLRSEQT